MKKMIAITLVLAMIMALGTVAFAADSNVDSENGSQDIDVAAKYVDGVVSGTKYSVDVSWGSMEFTYTVSGTKTWNPKTHEYDIESGAAWAGAGNEITVTNHSNTGITASFSFAPLADYAAVTGAFSANSIPLPTAEGKTVSDPALTGKTTLTLGGALDSSVTSMTKVGSVTVTIG